MRLVFLSLLVAAFALPARAEALPVRPWVGVDGSWGTYSMKDVNDLIGEFNTSLAGTGLSMDKIDKGWGFGASAGVALAGPISLGVGYERLTGSSDVSDPSGSFKISVPANLIRGQVDFNLPSPGLVNAHLGVAGGLVSEAGSVELAVTGFGSQKENFSGSGAMFEVGAGADLKAASQFGVSGTVGYRYAKVNEVKAAGQTLYTINGDKAAVDYSGVFVRLGVRIYLLP